MPFNLANAGTARGTRARVGVVLLLALVLLLGLTLEGRCQETSGSSFATFRPQPALSQAPLIGAASRGPAQPAPSPDLAAPRAEQYLIDLPTALRLADVQNPQIQFARERIRAAEAELDRANVLWLPNLSLGNEWIRHDGRLQDVRGPVFPVSKSALFTGGGPVARFALADAIFEPLAARQLVAARTATELATKNSTLLTVALAYWELIRDRAALGIAEETLTNSRQLDDLAQSWLKAGKLKPADAERVRVEFRVRTQELEAARENGQTGSIRLAQLLRLDPFVTLMPADRQALPITLVLPDSPPPELASLALGNRPELAESQALVRLTQERLRQADRGPLLPSIVLGYTAGGFGGGRNGFFGDYGGRGDADFAMVWELKNFGLADRALRSQRASEVRQALIGQLAEMDRVVAEVAEFLARMKSRRAQMDSARLAAEAAARSYALNWELFKKGGIELIRPIEVLQSLQALAKARQDYLSTVIEYNRAQFQLYWALGYPIQEAQPQP